MKVLVISYSPLTLSNNGGRYFISLLSSFSNTELIQLYISESLPDIEMCESYYQVTDKEQLPFSKRKSSHIVTQFNSIDNNLSQRVLGTPQKHRALKLMVRDCLWSTRKWNIKELDEWIKHEKPTCILADTGDSCFLYSLTMILSKKYQLPVIGGFGDDYYSLKASYREPIRKLQLWSLRNKINKFVKYCDKVFTINEYLTNYYKTTFLECSNKFFTLHMGNSVSFSESTFKSYSVMTPLEISYIGNMSYGRADQLYELGKAINEYNLKNNTSHKLNIYGKISGDLKEKLSKIPSIEIKGFIPGKLVKEAILSSDILIHVESFLDEYVAQTKYSLSTKIADSLASKRCILAYGPPNIASMQHLMNNDCAICACSPEELHVKLNQILSDYSLIEKYARNGYEVYEHYHASSKNSKILRDSFIDIEKE